MFWIERRGPWRDLPERFGNWNSVYQSFNRWLKKGGWERVFEALQEPDLERMMVDSTTVRTYQCAAGQITNATAEALGRSRGGFTTKVHAAVDALGNPLRFILMGRYHAGRAIGHGLQAESDDWQ